MTLKRILLIISMFIGFLSVTACSEAPVTSNSNNGNNKLLVYTSTYPLYDFANNIGGEKVNVINLIPAGMEPHSWEPSPRDIAKLQSADVFIFSGAGLEPWVDDIIASFNNKKPIVVDSSANITLESHNDTELAEHDHNHQNQDPHIWLDPLNAKIQVANITNALVKMDRKNAEYYQTNSEHYLEQLEDLHLLYQKRLAKVVNKKFITSHAAFGYLADRYGLEQIAIRGISPEAEPSPARLAELVKVATANNIKYIFFENMVSPKVSRTLAEEIGGGVLVLDPIAGMTDEQIKHGKDYITIMKENLNNLLLALGGSNED